MVRVLFLAGAVLAAPFVATAQELPVARPGQCFARVTIPAVYETYTEETIVQPEYVGATTIPARYEMVDTQVLAEPARTEQVVIPGVYRTVRETVMVAPERQEPVTVPARWETYTERVMVRPAYVTWKPGTGLYGRTQSAQGDLLCRVEVPAEYAQVQRRRMVAAEFVRMRTIPAVVRTGTRQELVTPARVEERQIPARYRTVKERRVAEPAREEPVLAPAVTRKETLRRVVSPQRTEWREVLCDTNASRAKIAQVQRALNARGYVTATDGVFGPATLASMERFQRANNLAAGYLTTETVQALGVSPQ
jgi:Putative peptidoglycan binding domain